MKLDQYLKWMGWVGTGGEAKQHIQSSAVTVNGSVKRAADANCRPVIRWFLAPTPVWLVRMTLAP